MKNLLIIICCLTWSPIFSQTVLITPEPFEILEEKKIEFAEEQCERAQKMIRWRRYPEALKLLDQNIKNNPDYFKSYALKGQLNYRQENFEASLANYDKAIELKGEKELDKILVAAKVRCLQKLKRHQEAVDLLDEAIEQEARFEEGYLLRGKSYYKLEKYRTAIKDYSKAIEFNSRNATYYYQRALAWHKIGRDDLAISDYDRAIKRRSRRASYYYHRAVSKEQQERYDAAMNDYDKAIQLDDEYTKAYYRRGHLQALLDKTAKALEDCNQAISLDSENAEAYYYKAMVLLKMNKQSEACKAIKKAQELGYDGSLDKSLTENCN